VQDRWFSEDRELSVLKKSYLGSFFWLQDNEAAMKDYGVSLASVRILKARQALWKRVGALLFDCDLSGLTVEAVDRDHVAVRGLTSLLPTFSSFATLAQRTTCVSSLIAHLMHMPEVVQIEPLHTIDLHNHLAVGAVESGATNGARLLSQSVNSLTGSGQVIGCVDTGVDDLSCFFRNHEDDQDAGEPLQLAGPANPLNSLRAGMCVCAQIA
jgi:hypothetical protein